MNSADYIEMKGFEVLLERVAVEIFEGKWADMEQEQEIIKEFLSKRYKYFKDQL